MVTPTEKEGTGTQRTGLEEMGKKGAGSWCGVVVSQECSVPSGIGECLGEAAPCP